MARAHLTDEVIEAALDQPHPTRKLRLALQGYLSFTKHRHRDKTRDPRRRAA
jgi:hypothetical protein